MAQINVRTQESATYVASEMTSFGATPPSMVRCFPIEGTFSAELEQKELENLDERTTLYDYLAPVRGMKDGKVKMEFYAKAHSVALSASATPAPHYMFEIFDAAWGSDGLAVDEGAVIDSTSTTTVLNVAAGQGAFFVPGTWLGATLSGTIEPARVVSVATDAVTVYPPLSSLPPVGASILNSITFAPDQDNANTLHIEHAKAGSTSLQWVLSGSTANINFDIKRNELVKIMVEGEVGSWQGPAAFGLSTAVATDDLTTPFACRDAVVLFRNAGTGVTDRTSYCLQSINIKTNGKMEFIDCLGGTDGKAGAFRKGQRMFASATLKFRIDQTVDATRWTNQDVTQCVVMIPKGTGLSKRWFIVDMPRSYIVGKPKLSEEAGLLYMEVTLNATKDTLAASGVVQTAPLRVAYV